MSNGVSTSTDKNIVDKSRSHRNKPVSKAVRLTRERLQSSHAPSGAFDRDVLALYINAVLQGASIVPLFVVIVAALGIYFTGDAQILPLGSSHPDRACGERLSRTACPQAGDDGRQRSEMATRIVARPVHDRLLLGGFRPAGLHSMRALQLRAL